MGPATEKKGNKSSSIDDDVSQTSTETKKAAKKFGRLKGLMARSFQKNRRNSKLNAKKITQSLSSKSQSGVKTRTPSGSKSSRGRGTPSESEVEEKGLLFTPRVVRRHISIDKKAGDDSVDNGYEE